MPEPKKQKKTFEAQVQTSIQGMQILPQAARKESSQTGSPENGHRVRGAGPAESSLVEKLIDFIKSMD